MRRHRRLLTWLLPVVAVPLLLVGVEESEGHQSSSFWAVALAFFPAFFGEILIEDIVRLSHATAFSLLAAQVLALYGLLGWVADGVAFRKRSKTWRVVSLLFGLATLAEVAYANMLAHRWSWLFDNPRKEIGVPSIPWGFVALVLIWLASKRSRPRVSATEHPGLPGVGSVGTKPTQGPDLSGR